MTIQSLPKYACPDLTGKPGFWAKALAEKYAESNALIHFYFTRYSVYLQVALYTIYLTILMSAATEMSTTG